MTNYQQIIDAQEMLVKYWGEDGKKVIVETIKAERQPIKFTEFLDYCLKYHDYGKMVLTGIDRLYPNVWEAIPDNMGVQAWGCLTAVLVLCGVNF